MVPLGHINGDVSFSSARLGALMETECLGPTLRLDVPNFFSLKLVPKETQLAAALPALCNVSLENVNTVTASRKIIVWRFLTL